MRAGRVKLEGRKLRDVEEKSKGAARSAKSRQVSRTAGRVGVGMLESVFSRQVSLSQKRRKAEEVVRTKLQMEFDRVAISRQL